MEVGQVDRFPGQGDVGRQAIIVRRAAVGVVQGNGREHVQSAGWIGIDKVERANTHIGVVQPAVVAHQVERPGIGVTDGLRLLDDAGDEPVVVGLGRQRRAQRQDDQPQIVGDLLYLIELPQSHRRLLLQQLALQDVL